MGDGRCEQVGWFLFLRCSDGWFDVAHQLLQMAGQGGAIVEHLDGRVDRAAVGMPKHHDQRRVENLHRVFEAGETIVIDEIAGETNDEEITGRLIESKLWRDARVGAAQDRGDRMLRRGARSAADRIILIGRCIGRVARIAIHDALQGLIGRDGILRCCVLRRGAPERREGGRGERRASPQQMAAGQAQFMAQAF